MTYARRQTHNILQLVRRRTHRRATEIPSDTSVYQAARRLQVGFVKIDSKTETNAKLNKQVSDRGRTVARRSNEKPVINVLKNRAGPVRASIYLNRTTQFSEHLWYGAESERTSAILKPASPDLKSKKFPIIAVDREMMKSIGKVNTRRPRVRRNLMVVL